MIPKYLVRLFFVLSLVLIAMSSFAIGSSQEVPWRGTWLPSRLDAKSGSNTDAVEVPVGLKVVASGLEHPVGIYHFGDGSNRLIVVEQTGTLRLIIDGELLEHPFLDLSGKAFFGEELGLLGFAAHPDFISNGVFFVSYTDEEGDSVIERYQVSNDPNLVQTVSGSVVLRVDQPGPSHNGGHLTFGPEGYLYIAFGDGDYVNENEFLKNSLGKIPMNSQNKDVRLGKLLRIDVDSKPFRIPADNPFASEGGIASEVWAMGLRSPWRFSFDRETGDLYIGDVGQVTTEEVSFVPFYRPWWDRWLKGGRLSTWLFGRQTRPPPSGQGGLNFGWPYLEGSRCTIEGCDATPYVGPIIEYGHDEGCSITGGHVYRGKKIPSLDGVYIYGDYCFGNILAAESTLSCESFRGCERSWQSVELFDTDIGISSFGEDEAGELYVTDHWAGVVYKLVDAKYEPITSMERFEGPPKQVYNRLTETLTKLGITYTEGENPSLSTTDLSALGLRVESNEVVTISAPNITITIETLGNNLNNSELEHVQTRLRLGTHHVRTRAVLTATDEFKALIRRHFEQGYVGPDVQGTYLPMFRFGINAGPDETKSVVRELLGDTIINEDSNLIHVEDLEIHFFAKAFDAGTYLAFDGTNTKLYEEIRNELERWSRLGAPQ